MSENKTLVDLQKDVDIYINQFKEGYFPPMEMLARLTEELGELSREIQHKYGTKKKKSTEVDKELAEEMGDFFFVLICLANAEGIDLQESLQKVLNKYNTRDKDRWTKKED
ncbi:MULTISPECIES: nucleotide pyrophosphohydrolase [Bacillaceae]|uniref:nucleotide pyrophosphohydrolase n=1 Tax=Bacillaceae TaxID=186817 RepID=UPI0006F34F5D|nr:MULTISPECIES: nucleotide pyrophosphohydrolase [Bacillaceae]KQL35699.1 nucleotide pyrophosphohydrolase [Psychrobacillus sp. FJAT-21963]MDF2067163.1 nucleotide pyrophosphohydrolase [Bacillus sp. Cr_A10]